MTILSNVSSQSVAPAGVINVGSVVSQKGCATQASGNGIAITKPGIYDITATVVGLVTGGGIMEFSVMENGTAIGYLVGQTYTNTEEPATVTLTGHIVVNPNCCAVTNNLPTTISLQNTSTTTTAVISNVMLDVTKVDC